MASPTTLFTRVPTPTDFAVRPSRGVRETNLVPGMQSGTGSRKLPFCTVVIVEERSPAVKNAQTAIALASDPSATSAVALQTKSALSTGAALVQDSRPPLSFAPVNPSKPAPSLRRTVSKPAPPPTASAWTAPNARERSTAVLAPLGAASPKVVPIRHEPPSATETFVPVDTRVANGSPFESELEQIAATNPAPPQAIVQQTPPLPPLRTQENCCSQFWKNLWNCLCSCKCGS